MRIVDKERADAGERERGDAEKTEDTERRGGRSTIERTNRNGPIPTSEAVVITHRVAKFQTTGSRFLFYFIILLFIILFIILKFRQFFEVGGLSQNKSERNWNCFKKKPHHIY